MTSAHPFSVISFTHCFKLKRCHSTNNTLHHNHPNLTATMSSSDPAPNRNRSFGTEAKLSGNGQTDAKPLLSRYSSSSGSFKQMPRRRVPGKPDMQRSYSRDIGHAAAETYMITRLTITLLRYLGVGYRWITRLAALGFYAALLMPGFLQVAYYYFFSSQVRRSIVYGDQPRNRLDLYLPKKLDGPKPVVAFVTGGAWIIGYKAWGCLLGQQLAERDIIVACIDYRNFPQGTIGDMVADASQGISFICNNISEYGGDPNRIYLMGQSAGAHISACTLLEQAIREAKGEEGISWSVSQIKAYFGLSGGYNLCKLVDHFNNRGLYRALFLSMMEGEESLQSFSPELRIEDPSIGNAVSLLPPIILFHGTADYSIPSSASIDFAAALQRLGAQAELILFDGKTHTDLFLQDPLRGGKDEMFSHLVAVIHAGDEEALAKDATAPPRRRLVPEVLLRMASHISPF
ncbi:isoprenylcysteine alpha-carbonyl methylesterase ICME-like [Populus alba x Populus x berolinensis]|nr:isoprenylcysteine alpha-carbonyl methylesterase ICME-like [Populus alba]KAG6743080.1 hypothetical protein POTOM_054025 [Populus tomentosa]KAJ6867193.1 isoprenylcysteine alpha-carbonyl methylesterase ICME-like [Populus alba x Populus x berolinensis]TKS00476.1 hypothetical protein D5086_0000183400 [Populus alba]